MTHRAILLGAFATVMGCAGEIETIGGPGPTPAPTQPGNGTPSIENPTPPAPPPPSHAGFVYLYTTEYEEAPGKTTYAVFSGAWFGLPTAAAGQPLSGCELRRFDDEAPATSEPEPVSDNAGTVFVEGTFGTEKNAAELLFDKKRKVYDPFSGEVDGPPAGNIRFRAPGGVVPAFSVDLVPRAPVTIVAPAAGSKVGARDLPVAFTQDPDADVTVVVVGSIEKEIRCAATKGTNEVVVPAALMTEVLDDERTTGIGLSVYSGKSRSVDVGDYRVTVQHSSSLHRTVLKE